MLAFIEGKVCEKFPDRLVMNHQGMGFVLNYDSAYAGRLPALGEEGRIYVYLHVRENELALYAFPSPEDKQLFEILLTVSGIGPKVAETICASLGPGKFAMAVVEADVKALTQIRGIGKKTAERLILELKDKLGKSDFIDENDAALQNAGDETKTAIVDEAESALAVLGYSRPEARGALKAALAKSPESREDLDLLLRLALREMAVI